MHRRKFLAGIGALISVSAGCLDSQNSPVTEGAQDASLSSLPASSHSPASEEPENATDDGHTETAEKSWMDVANAYDPDNVIKSVTIGQRGTTDPQPHFIRLWSGAKQEQRFALKLRDTETEELLYDESLTLGENTWFEAILNRASSYRFCFQVAEDGPKDSLLIPAERFDCNETRYYLGVFGDGNSVSGRFSEQAGCTTPASTGSE